MSIKKPESFSKYLFGQVARYLRGGSS